MKIHTKDLIKILPFDAAVKNELFERFDMLDPDQKYNISQMLWDAYDTLYALKLEENIQLALVRAKEGIEPLNKDFYKRVREQTEKEMQSETLEKTESADLDAARKAMEVIVKEIHAAKKAK